eukprot:5138778-Pyramimonas_sp.AAC.1
MRTIRKNPAARHPRPCSIRRLTFRPVASIWVAGPPWDGQDGGTGGADRASGGGGAAGAGGGPLQRGGGQSGGAAGGGG